jgi:hypothetical protein
MARGIIGGIVLSTLVTLVLVPVFYVLVERLRGLSGNLLVVPAGADEHAPVPQPQPPGGIRTSPGDGAPGPRGPAQG